MVTCLNCSFMQEIAEYPLILVSLMLWHYRITGDKEYLRKNFAFARVLVDIYRREYEQDGLLQNLDKWCVVEWPPNCRDAYDVDIQEGKICEQAHMVINPYYIEAIRNLNMMAEVLNEHPYRNIEEMREAFPLLCGIIKYEKETLPNFLLDEGAWLRMLREDATTTFEGWGKDCKKNASLFHLTMTYAAIFMADIDHESLFR